jgi:hypothetical protein
MKPMKSLKSILSGLGGSLTLTLLHQLLKGHVTHAPRMDLLGKQALTRMVSLSSTPVPPEKDLYNITLAGDITGNALYYSVVDRMPGNKVVNGALLGAAAGVGALVLPGKLGLNPGYSNATRKTQVLTVAIYLAGGLMAGLLSQQINKKAPKLLK